MSKRNQRFHSTNKSGQSALNKTSLSTYETQQDDLRQNESMLRSILYDFNASTTTEEKLSQMKNCLNELPLDMIRNVAFLPDNESSAKKEPKTSKEILDTTKGFTTKMRVSFMRIKNSLDPNINASTLQNFFKRKQQQQLENQRFKDTYASELIQAKEEIAQEETQRSSPLKLNQFSTPQSSNSPEKQLIRRKTNNISNANNQSTNKKNAFQLQQTENVFLNKKNISQMLDENDLKLNQSNHQSALHLQNDNTEMSFNYYNGDFSTNNNSNNIKLSPLSHNKYQQSDFSTSDSPQNQYAKSKSTQDRSTLSRKKMIILYPEEELQTDCYERDNKFYDIQTDTKSGKKNNKQIQNSTRTPQAYTSRSLSTNTNGGRNKLVHSDNKKDNIFNVLHNNYNNNPNYTCQKKRTDLTTQNKTVTDEAEIQNTNQQPYESLPLKTAQSPQRKSTKQVLDQGFFQKKIRRNALIDLRKLNPNIEKMTQYSKDFLPPWLRARPDFMKLYLQNQINHNLQLPQLFLKEQNYQFNSCSNINQYTSII